MRLAEFILTNIDKIIDEWELFAGSLNPAHQMTRAMLRDHSREIISFIAHDVGSPQSSSEQLRKSQGKAVRKYPNSDTAAEIHGALRLEHGFDLNEMVSEFRALRAIVTKLWMAASVENEEIKTLDLIRFNESIDQTLQESVSRFTKNIDTSRNLFLGILGHDLRNPLGAIAMASQLFRMKGPLNDTQSMLLNQIQLSGDRAIEIVNDLLELARARLGSNIPAEMRSMDFGRTADLIFNETKTLRPERIIYLFKNGDLLSQGDAARIKQVISNLLGNAIQYGEADKPITLEVNGQKEGISISVHNFGEPIPSTSIANIFDSLVRSVRRDGSNDDGGKNLGLGLYISKVITEAHKGELSVTSNKAEGTTFTAFFPRTASSNDNFAHITNVH